MVSAAAPVRPSDAVNAHASSFSVGDGIWIDNGGCVGAGRITGIAATEKPTGYMAYDLTIETSAGQVLAKRVTAMHKGLYKSRSLAA